MASKKPFYQVQGEFFMPPTDTRPIKGYSVPKNEETGKEFPFCCDFHEGVYNSVVEYLKEFPNCCDEHKAFAKGPFFDMKYYTNLPMKIVMQVHFTEHHITTVLEDEDWLNEIQDYIDYTLASFGHPAIGLNYYLNNIRHAIDHNGWAMPDEKKDQLLSFIDSYSIKSESDPVDLDILYDVYRKWLDAFPFEIEFFKKLKPIHEKNLPFLAEKPRINRYSKQSKAKIISKNNLVRALLTRTRHLLSQIDIPNLIETGVFEIDNKSKMEFASASLKTGVEALVKEYSEGEIEYLDVLNQWLSLHQKYFDTVGPIMREDRLNITSKADENVENVIEQLNEFELKSFISKSKFRLSTVRQLMQTHNGKEFMPYTIALLHCIGYLHYFIDHQTTKSKAQIQLGKIFGRTPRQMQGNINVLNPILQEDASQYTSIKYVNQIKKALGIE